MSLPAVIFNFRDERIKIECMTSEKLRNICEKFISQMKENNTKLYFKYNSNLINEDLKFEELINKEDKKLNKMNILVEEEKKIEIRELKEKDIKDKIKYENINNKNDNYIIAEIKINKKDINKDIRKIL